ncbi:hypothetical protein Scep_030704 [Stephania cephalantha]|uniref:RING-type domain-containing protein n=1 Tax=Stephania cephalantha TaxID=152367 RepID=A0AAP0E7Y4_9MAGN
MKFCKKYREYMKQREVNVDLPGVGFKQLKKILKRCPKRESIAATNSNASRCGDDLDSSLSGCPDHCPVCDGTFFSSLLNEMSTVVGCFNERAQKLLGLHLATGLQKYMIWFRSKQWKSHSGLIQEGKELVVYAMINAIADFKEIHYCKQGQAFISQAQIKHLEILRSPWLCELIAFHINLREGKHAKKRAVPDLFDGCSLAFEFEKPILSCALFDSVKVDIHLTCSICLDTVFDPVALTCGHILCYMCACSAASVNIVDGLKAANPRKKCPLCREAGVYEGAVHLEELNILLSRRPVKLLCSSIKLPLNCFAFHYSCPEYWEQRLQAERVDRVRQTKEYWESQCRAFMGV